jgi:hypothetical protein
MILYRKMMRVLFHLFSNVGQSSVHNISVTVLFLIMGFVKNDKSVPCRFLGLESVSDSFETITRSDS